MKKKKSLIAIVALLLVVAVGVTFAYFQSSAVFENVFNAGKYKVTLTEVFESPDNWVPGETVPKTVTAKNDGTVPAAVRISYTEQWLQEIDGVETDITSQVNPNPAIINFDNQDDWTSSNGYYYYKYILEPTDETGSFISGVTLDPNLDSVTCTGEGNTKTCEAQNSASGAKYKLTFTIQTVQYDQYQGIWNTNVEITNKPALTLPTGRTKDNLQVGDEICIEGTTTECFNFIGYEDNDIKMLAKWNLNVGNNPKGTATNLQDSDVKGYVSSGTKYGNVAFSQIDYWFDGSNLKSKYGSSYPADVYDTDYVTGPNFSGNGFYTTGYSIAYYVEEYKDKLEDYGVTINDARLLTYAEATGSSIGCDGSNYSCPTNGFITNTSFWLGSAYDFLNVWFVIPDGNFRYSDYSYDNSFGVRPVIVISKDNI